jgi:cytochrome c oxidase subunit 2
MMKRVLATTVLIAAISLPLVASAGAAAEQDFQAAARATPDPEHGEQLFRECAGCHGVDGGGDARGHAPRIAGQFAGVIIRQLLDYRYDKRVDPRMEGLMEGHLVQSVQDLADVAAYVAQLEPAGPAGNGGGRSDLQQAARLYSARCGACHGPAALGNEGALIPRLAGQNYAYLQRQFHDALEGRRPKLGSSHAADLRDLDRDALEGLAEVLSRMDRIRGN